VLLMLFGALALSRRLAWAQWATTAFGLWLLFAPLIFWTPSAAAYINDTAIGALAIIFSILVPMMPGMNHAGMMDRSTVPPGWTYSPSSRRNVSDPQAHEPIWSEQLWITRKKLA
jgi:hypothetical protein